LGGSTTWHVSAMDAAADSTRSFFSKFAAVHEFAADNLLLTLRMVNFGQTCVGGAQQ
jgi:hypothetical protein